MLTNRSILLRSDLCVRRSAELWQNCASARCYYNGRFVVVFVVCWTSIIDDGHSCGEWGFFAPWVVKLQRFVDFFFSCQSSIVEDCFWDLSLLEIRSSKMVLLNVEREICVFNVRFLRFNFSIGSIFKILKYHVANICFCYYTASRYSWPFHNEIKSLKP